MPVQDPDGTLADEESKTNQRQIIFIPSIFRYFVGSTPFSNPDDQLLRQRMRQAQSHSTARLVTLHFVLPTFPPSSVPAPSPVRRPAMSPTPRTQHGDGLDAVVFRCVPELARDRQLAVLVLEVDVADGLLLDRIPVVQI